MCIRDRCYALLPAGAPTPPLLCFKILKGQTGCDAASRKTQGNGDHQNATTPKNTGKQKPPRCHHWENTIQQKPPEQATDAAVSKTQRNGGHHDATIGKTPYFVPRAVAIVLGAQCDKHQFSIAENCWHAWISAISLMSTNFALQRIIGMCFPMVRAFCGTLGNTVCTKRHACSIRLRRGH